ncbi:MAG: hypothetical protein ABSG22_11995 [Sedimentisphaerales bacterium]
MTRNNITIVILAILIVVLCVLCYIGRPLIKDQYVPEIGTLLNSIDRTKIGDKILNHYLNQIREDVIYRIGPTKGLKLEDKERIYPMLAGRLFAALVALAGFIAGVALFLINSGGHQLSVSKTKTAIMVAMVILAGTLIRLILAKVVFGNFDMQSYETVVGILNEGGNVYAKTARYNYSPVWFMVLLALKQIQLAFDIPFYFVVRTFLCCVDLLTLGVLLFIANIRKLPPVRTAIFFYLSPVSFLVTGYHGQFENFAMLMVLIGILMYLRFTARPVLGTALLWLFATAGMIVKHNVFYELVICLQSSIKRYSIKLFLFAVSVVIFLLLFVPYWKTGSKGIIEHAFKYGSYSGVYGLTSLFAVPQLKYFFIVAMFFFPFYLKSRDIIAQCLLGVLFFLTFTTGFSAQYFVLPVALATIRPSKFYLFYTIAASALLLGNNNNVFIPGFHLLKLNVVWVVVICWFVSEMWFDRKATTCKVAVSKKGKKCQTRRR